MASKATIASLTVIAILLSGGIGYAAFTSTANINVTATAGYTDLEINSISLYQDPPTYVSPSYITIATTTIPASTVTATLGSFAPGDTAYFLVTYENYGNIPATLSSGSSNYVQSVSCPSTGGLVNSLPLDTTISPGGTFTALFFVEASLSLGNSCQSQPIGTLTLSITGSD